MAWLKRLFGRDAEAEKGSIVIMGALSLVGIMGMSGLAVEAGAGYAAKVRNQRVADMAALGAASAYSATSNYAAAVQTAKDIVLANGVTTVPTVTPDNASAPTQITVSVTTSQPIKLASMIASGPSYNVTNAATAALGGGSVGIGCIMALDTGATYGISLSGSTKINAPSCSVNTNSSINVDGSSSITGKTVGASGSVTVVSSGSVTADTITAGGSINWPSWNGSAMNGTKRPNTSFAITDPMAGNSDLAAAFAKLGVVSPAAAPVMPASPGIASTGSDWTFVNSDSAWAALPNSNPVKANCTYSAPAFTCAANTYAINNLTVPGGVSVRFLPGATNITVYGTFSNGGSGMRFDAGSGSNFVFRNDFNTGSSGVIFGDANVYIGGAATLNASSGFGNGTITINGIMTTGGSSTVNIGTGAHAFGGINVGGSGRLTVGAGNLNVTGGIITGGSTTTTFGDGVYRVGAGSGNWSVYHVGNTLTFGNGTFDGAGGLCVNGSSTLTFSTGAMTLGAASSGQCNGASNSTSKVIFGSGSSTITLPTGNLNANGAIWTDGSSRIVYGAGSEHNINGTLTINGGMTMGAGRYTVNGDFYKSASMAVNGSDVTIIALGSFYTGGSSSTVLSAPSFASGGGIANVLFASKSTANTTIEGSSSNTMSGIFYMPNSALTISGAGTAGSGTCLALIVKTITISGSSTLTDSSCTTPTVGAPSSVKLIR